MKTIITYLTIVFLLLAGNIAFSQTPYVFRVLANKGKNQVKRSSGNTEGLKTGATLKAGDQLIASSGAYIGLMHKTGKTLEVRKPGVIKVNDLEKKVASLKTSVTSRYTQYVLNKINEEDGGIRNNFRRNMNATGSAERALSEGEKGIDFILPVSDNKVKVYNPNVVLRWAIKKEAEIAEGTPYIVSVKNIFEEEIFRQETDKSTIELDLDSDTFKEFNDLLLITINAKVDNPTDASTSKEYGIERLTFEELVDLDDLKNDPTEQEKVKELEKLKQLKEEIEKIQAEIDPASGMGKMMLATFYDENGLLLDAMTMYETLVRENPEVTDFQDLYTEFLAKNSMITSLSQEEIDKE